MTRICCGEFSTVAHRQIGLSIYAELEKDDWFAMGFFVRTAWMVSRLLNGKSTIETLLTVLGGTFLVA